MSLRAMVWAYDQDVKPSGVKFILVTLANYANEEGYCYPSHKRIARDTGMSVRSVITHLATLEEHGFIRKEERLRPNQSQTSNGYWLVGFTEPSAESAQGGEKSAPPPVKKLHGGGEKSAPPEPPVNSQENQKTPSESPSQPHVELFEGFLEAKERNWESYTDRKALGAELNICKSLARRGYSRDDVKGCTLWCMTWADVVGMKLVAGQIDEWRQSGRPTAKSRSRKDPGVSGAGSATRLRNANPYTNDPWANVRPPDTNRSYDRLQARARERRAREQAEAQQRRIAGS